MSLPLFQQPLSGIIPPMITPLRDRESLDGPGLTRLVEHLLEGGVAGLFVLGTTGEGPSLGYRTRYQMVEETCDLVRRRVPVLVGVTDSSLGESLELARFAADVGASAIVAAPPYYFPIDQQELTAYYLRLAEESPLPLVLYNMPSCVKIPLEPITIAACSRHPRIVGIKDSSGSLETFTRMLEFRNQRPDWTMLIGPEHFLGEATIRGGHGGVSGGANLFPRLYVRIYEAARNGDSPSLSRLQEFVTEIYAVVYGPGGSNTGTIKGIKAVLEGWEMCHGFVAEPLLNLDVAQQAIMVEKVRDLKNRIESELQSLPQEVI